MPLYRIRRYYERISESDVREIVAYQVDYFEGMARECARLKDAPILEVLEFCATHEWLAYREVDSEEET